MAKERNRQIEEDIKKQSELQTADKSIKMMLLGAGDSGKSTVLKQLRICNGEDFNVSEKKYYKKLMISNIMTSIEIIAKAAVESNIDLELHKRIIESIQQKKLVYNEAMINLDDAQGILSLWNDKRIHYLLNTIEMQDTAP